MLFCTEKNLFAMSPLIKAADQGNLTELSRLLESGVDVNQTDEDGRTALRVASEKGNTEVIQKLLKTGANVDQPDHWGNTPLMAALRRPKIVQQLLDAGANVNQTNTDGNSPLINATSNLRTEVVSQLLKVSGINVNHVGRFGYTALLLAVEYGHIGLVEALLAAGANVNHELEDGITALKIAKENNHYPLIQLLEAAAAVAQSNEETEDRSLESSEMRVQQNNLEDCMRTSLTDLPVDVLVDIFSYLNYSEMLNIRKVCLNFSEGNLKDANSGAVSRAWVNRIKQDREANRIIPVSPQDPRVNPNFASIGKMYEVAGLIWSGVAKQRMNQKEAIDYCRSVGGELPTKHHYRALVETREKSDRRYRNLQFFDMGSSFWTASSKSEDEPYLFHGFNINGYYGRLTYTGYSGISYASVRCIQSAQEFQLAP
jgi:ankyrin repeat protein